MNKRAKYNSVQVALILSVSAIMFQNCSAAPPPDMDKISQSSLYQPGGYIPTPQGTPAAVATPVPTEQPSTPTPTPASITCAARTLNWGEGCSYALPTTTYPYSTGTVQNQAAGFIGSATFNCNSNGQWSAGSTSCSAEPTPTPPVTQTYSWKAGNWGQCDGSKNTRTVQCINGAGSVVADSFCAGVTKPATQQACSLPYSCTATLTPIYFEFGSFELCSYACTGPNSTTYNVYAVDATNCNANPIGVPGTETGYSGTNYSTAVNRPFSRCVITQAMTYDPNSGGKVGKSSCE